MDIKDSIVSRLPGVDVWDLIFFGLCVVAIIGCVILFLGQQPWAIWLIVGDIMALFVLSFARNTIPEYREAARIRELEAEKREAERIKDVETAVKAARSA